MPRHLDREIENLKRKILSLSAVVEESVHRAVQALNERDARTAAEILAADIQVDQAEVDVEEECLKVLALYQPVAIDLRFIVAVLKINNDLERVGDMAANIAERAAFLAQQPPHHVPIDFRQMAEKTQAMLRKSLDSLVNMDPVLALQVCAADDEVDAINRQMYDRIQDAIRAHPEQLEALMHLLAVSRHLERIADHATNIAEDVVYMVQGDIVRHRAADYQSQV
jgi:phosphate transport system protein